MNIADVEFEKADDDDALDEILSIINNSNIEQWREIIPEEHYKEPFLTKAQINEMSTYMEFYVFKKSDEIIAVGSFGKRDENTAWIPLMYVRSDFQKRGIGSALMAYLEIWRRIGISKKYT
ncbi:MAG: GNAT family N-acetyltransferase [Candidatus Thorarchaeota archaeon]|nr:GNAT family N-acetyltransferase [Candidatus Thorarchaeota archaeon]